ncbi:hypothetical protein [Microbacterium sp. LMC-P-041]|uniref:hypothetical protein n=1 Tax=Microbacterium sp. LMC-P-041 TaxID=3040293 RepID=UPI0033068593
MAAEAAATAASTRKRRLLVPAERASDLLERGQCGLEVFGSDRVGDLGADAVDDGTEAVFRRAAVVGERPAAVAVGVGDDPAALDQAVQLVCVEGAAGRRGAVDDVQHPPVAAACMLAVESGLELGGHQAVDGLQPIAEGAGGAVCVLSVRGVHGWSP